MRFIAKVAVVALLTCAARSLAGEPIKTDGSQMGLTIMGAIVGQDSDGNVALIKESSGKVEAVKRGHVVLKKYKVVHITNKYIELITEDATRYIVYQNKFAEEFASTRVNPGSGPSLQGAGDDYYREEGFERTKDRITMTGMYRDKLVNQDLARVLMQCSAEPVIEDGAIAGFKLTQIDEGSIYAKSGLRNSDTVTGINNHPLSSVAGAVTLLRSLKNTDQIEVDLLRNGQPMHIVVKVLD